LAKREKNQREKKPKREIFNDFFQTNIYCKNKEAPKFFNKYFIVNNLKASLFGKFARQ